MNFPREMIKTDLESVSLGTKVFCSFFSPTCMSLGCVVLASWESKSTGLQWSNISRRPSASEEYTMATCFIMLIFDSIVYYILALYIDMIRQSEFGTALPWYFPLMKTYWFPENG